MRTLFDDGPGWTPPATLPDLSSARRISVDVETKDPHLVEKGPGTFRKDGHVLGVAIATDDGFTGYFPIEHEDESGPRFPDVPGAVASWLRAELSRPSQEKVGSHVIYDLDWLGTLDVGVEGPLRDVGIAEALIDENRPTFSLDSIARERLGRGKARSGPEKYAAMRGWAGDVRRHLWRMPSDVVGPYAEEDARLALEVYDDQRKILRKEALGKVFELESRLIRTLLKVRRTGVRIDVARLEEEIAEWEQVLARRSEELDSVAGRHVDFWAAESIAEAFNRAGIDYPRTKKKEIPSFTKTWLEALGEREPLAAHIVDCRVIDKLVGTFLRGSLLEMLVGDRIHCLYNQVRRDDYGARSGRLSASLPNLQFIPARGELGTRCRRLFIPEEDHEWGKADYSQVEFRIFAHYALGDGAEEFRESYRRNPRIDYHKWTADESDSLRDDAKTTNFGLIYGMGLPALARRLGMSVEKAREFLARYERNFPFMRTTISRAMNKASMRGFVMTILGRRRRFPFWEPADYELAKRIPMSRDKKALLEEEALKEEGVGVRRAGVHKALNGIIQGSAADLIKKAMNDLDEAGILEILKMHLTVHDELDFSIPRTREGSEAWTETVEIMERALSFKVPIVVDAATGPNWGETR